MYFDRTITIYNKLFINRKTEWRRTVIHGASWAGCQKVTTGEGLTSNDGYSVRIKKEALPKGFVLRDAFVANPNGNWTAQNGDVVVLGEGPEVTDGITEITKQFTDCFTVIAVHTDNLNRNPAHLRLEGK